MATSILRKVRIRMNNNNSVSALPDEIWIEILLYLTAKDLHSSKTVSKLWYSIISNPNFVNTHLMNLKKQQSQSLSQQILITTTTKPTKFIPFYQFDHYSIINNNGMMMSCLKKLQGGTTTTTSTLTPAKALCLKASCDGLLLFQNKYDPTRLYISNPATSLFKPLALSPCKCSFWALVHDTLIDKYKVFGILSASIFLVHTLGETTTSRWSVCSFQNNTPPRHFHVLSPIILFQNELLWLSSEYQDSDNVSVTDQRCYCIFSINVETHMFNKIKIPLHIWNYSGNDIFRFFKCNGLHLLSEAKGSLYLTTVSQFKLEMFHLHDRLNSVWTKSHTISLQSLSNRPAFFNGFLLDDICLVPMTGVDPSNLADFVKVVIHHEDQLLLYDLSRQECTQIGFLENGQKLCRPYLFHSDSLVSLKSESLFLLQCCKTASNKLGKA